MEKITKLKTYEITYEPSFEVNQKLVDPYDKYGSTNAYPRYFYSPTSNRVETVRVDALSKETAKALFAIRLYTEIMSIDIEGGGFPYIFDGIRSITSIEEVKYEE